MVRCLCRTCGWRCTTNIDISTACKRLSVGIFFASRVVENMRDYTITKEFLMVIRHILQYWLVHPEAKDTLQGILQWWLPGDRAEQGAEAVQAALEALVAQRWVTRRQTLPAPAFYGLNQDKREEIQAFLQGLENQRDG
jgi:hypothetical protein